MPKDYSRTERIGEQIQRELATLIQMEMRDPRVKAVTVNHVDVTRDLSLARVYITLMGSSSQDEAAKKKSIDEALTVLNKAAGFLKRSLGSNLLLRVVPNLDFRFDASVERGVELSSLIDQAVAEDVAKSEASQKNSSDDEQ